MKIKIRYVKLKSRPSKYIQSPSTLIQSRRSIRFHRCCDSGRVKAISTVRRRATVYGKMAGSADSVETHVLQPVSLEGTREKREGWGCKLSRLRIDDAIHTHRLLV